MNSDGLLQIEEAKKDQRKEFYRKIAKLINVINDEDKDIKTYLYSEEAIYKKYKDENYIEMVINFDDVEKITVDCEGVFIVDINGHRQSLN